MYRSILIPVDGSPFAEQALLLAANVAQRVGAALQVVMVMDRYSPLWSTHVNAKLVAERRAYLDRIIERVRSQATISVSAHLLDGDVAPAIRAHAESNRVDLVVMSTHGRGALGRFWIGSVADQLIHSLPIPLLLTRPGAASAIPDSNPKHFLIPLDGGQLAERILGHATELGTLLGADYTLVRVIDAVPYGTPVFEALEWSKPSIKLLDELHVVQQQVHDQALAYLDGVAARLRSRALHVQTRVVTQADPGAAILEFALSPTIDLIAIETRGQRCNFLLGSVARKIIHGMSVLVLVQSAMTAAENIEDVK